MPTLFTLLLLITLSEKAWVNISLGEEFEFFNFKMVNKSMYTFTGIGGET